MPRKRKNLTGFATGMLTVIKFSHMYRKSSYWLCECECGNEKVIRGSHITAGDSMSCGCARIVDIAGQQFRWLTVLNLDRKANGTTYWEVECKCGNKKILSRSSLHGTKSCGCAYNSPIKDLTGKIFGRLKVLKFSEIKNHETYWLCKCECCNEKVIKGSYLSSGGTKSCGCLKFHNLVNKRFGKLVVLRKSYNTGKNYIVWHCKCDCGNEKNINASSLKDGSTKSCGCLFDVSGFKINYLTFKCLDYTKNRKSYWICLCDCGNKVSLRKDQVLNGHTKSCGCKTRKLKTKSFKKTRDKKYNGLWPMQTKEIARKSAQNQTNNTTKYHWKTNEKLICQGSWEAKVVDYLNDNNINFRWQSKTFKMPNGKTYRPDLYLFSNKKWIEIKGYFRKDAKAKWNWFHKEHPNSELWDKNVLKEMKIL